MIDIFGEGPYLSNVGELFIGSLAEFAVYYAHFFLFAAAVWLCRRIPARRRMPGMQPMPGKRQISEMQTIPDRRQIPEMQTIPEKQREQGSRRELAAAILLPIAPIVWTWLASIRSEFFLSFCLAALLTAQLYLLDLLPMKPLDYAFVFSALLFPTRLFNSTSSAMGHLWIFWILFSVLYAEAKLCLKTLKGNHLICYFLFVFLALTLYSCTLFLVFLTPAISARLHSHALGCIVSMAIPGAAFLLASWVLRKKAVRQIRQLNRSGAKYRQIERSFFLLSLVILLTFTLLYIPATFMRMQNAFVSLLIPLSCLAFLWGQLPFLSLLFRFALYRDSATFHEWEKEGIASYYRELNQSLSAMQELRHDIKNIFFTMGNFVDRSGDQEMKDFFWQNIYPYSVKTIEKSELMSKLYQIPAESLRAFFHLKLSQAMQQRLSLHFEVKLFPEQFQTGIDIIDLIRILGILLDNAIEESRRLPEGMMEIKIVGNETGCSYVIKNTITEETRRTGIRPGKSQKGAGHGNGLRIVQELLERYPCAVLNSSMQGNLYVQSLNITFAST